MNQKGNETPQSVVVTGAARGIGRALCESFLARGSLVAALDHDEGTLNELREQCGEKEHLLLLGCDVSNEEDVRTALATTEKALGPIHALVNNAAISEPGNAPLAELELYEWRRVMATNLDGVFLCSKHALRSLRSTRGSIVNISSTRALMSEPHTEAYSAAKGALVSFSHALAMSEGPLVRVNCVSPGWIENNFGTRSTLREIDHEQHPVGRAGTPEDVVELCAFLLSPRAGFITGQNFVVDGGMTKKMLYVDDD